MNAAIEHITAKFKQWQSLLYGQLHEQLLADASCGVAETLVYVFHDAVYLLEMPRQVGLGRAKKPVAEPKLHGPYAVDSRQAVNIFSVIPQLSASQAGRKELRVSVFLPASWFLYQRIQLPAAIKADLEQALDYQLQALYALPVERFVNRCQIVAEGKASAKSEGEELDIAVLSAPVDRLQGIEQAAQEQGIRLQGIHPLMTSVAQAQSLASTDVGALCLLDSSDAEHPHVSLAEQGKLLASVRLSASQLEQGEAALAPIYQQAGVQARPQLLQSGSPDRMQLLSWGQQLSAPPFNYLSAQGKEFFRQLQRRKQAVLAVSLTAILLLLITLPGWFSMLQRGFISQKLSNLEQDNSALLASWDQRAAVTGLEEVLFEVPAADQLRVLQELAERLPKDSWLNYYRSEGAYVEIRGNAKRAADVITALSVSELFDEVEFVRPVSKSNKGAEEVFGIQLHLSEIDAEGFFERYVR